MATKVLTIAGTDPSGGAGIQADLKTFSALGVYGASVVTALVAQNTQGVTAIHSPDVAFLAAQLASVFEDIEFSAVKIGMLADTNVIETVAQALKKWQPRYVIVDPVMVAKSGDHLLQQDAIDALIENILPLASIITPNLPEAAVLLKKSMAANEEEMRVDGLSLVELTGANVLMKGGHLINHHGLSPDWLITAHNATKYVLPRVNTKAGHGTGCTLSAAIASLLAKGHSYEDAVQEAKIYLHGALEKADELAVGKGVGPVHHFHRWWS